MWKRRRYRVVRVDLTVCLIVWDDQRALQWLNMPWGHTMDTAMANHGMFHGAIHGKNVLHGIGHGTVHAFIVCTRWYISWHLREPWSSLVHVGSTMEHAMVYSLVPDDASVDTLRLMNEPTNQMLRWHMPGSPKARSMENTTKFPAWLAPSYIPHGPFRETKPYSHGVCHGISSLDTPWTVP